MNQQILEVGTFVKTIAPQVIEVLGTTGLHFVVADAEHAPFDRASLDLAMLAGRAVNMPVFVRVHDQQASTLGSVLDLGAAGVLVPHVDTPGEARNVVAGCRFRGGKRGYSGSPRSSGYGASSMASSVQADDRIQVWCQIESEAAVKAAAEIAAVPGVAGLFIGRGDLALSMGFESSQVAAVDEATEVVIEAGLVKGKRIGMFVNSLEELDRYAAKGVTWLVHGSDQSLLRSAAQRITRRS